MAISRVLLERSASGKLVKTSSTVASLGAKTVATTFSGLGGLDSGVIAASTFYYVYLVTTASSFGLVASTSESSPTGFSNYLKVGAFYTDGSSNIFKVYYFGEVNKISFNAKISSGGIVSEEDVNWINANASLNNTSEYIFDIVTAYRTVVAMNIQLEGWNSTSGLIQYSHMATTSTSTITIQMYNGGTRSQQPFQILATKTGIDSVQPDWTRQ